MALLDSDYVPPWYWKNRHLQTILPNRLRRVNGVEYDVERTVFGRDEIDLYWSKAGGSSVVLVAHGLGGHVHRPYVKGMVRALNAAGLDACAWPVWGTDDVCNLPPFCYHGGYTGGLRAIVQHLIAGSETVGLVGFSLGGNVVLKYLGEEGDGSGVAAAVTLSVPCDLKASASALGRAGNRVIEDSFLKTLKRRVRVTSDQDPTVSTEALSDVDSIVAYDDLYTAPLNGFSGADDYYDQSNSLQYIEHIRTPTLLVNAVNDPFLTASCFPTELCRSHPLVDLEMPRSGGHVGFPLGRGIYWSEERASTFLHQHIKRG